jgi:ADP-ribosylglycohydrolase
VNRACSLIYLGWLTALLEGEEPESDYTDIPEEVEEQLQTLLEEEDRELDGKNKGWVLHAFWCAHLALTVTSFTDLMQYLIEKKGDTDTNAAIAGAVYGARVGFQKLMEEQEENWDILLSSEHIAKQLAKNRSKYCPIQFLELF